MFNKEVIRALTRDILDSFCIRGFEVEVTNVCNFQCIYCGSNTANIAEKKDIKVLPFEKIKSLVDEISNPQWVGFSGGEPTLPLCFPTVLKGIEYTKKKGGCTELFTNGSAPIKFVEQLEKAGLDIYHVSLPTLDPRKFTDLRLGSEKIFSHVLDNIRFAIECTKMSVTIEALAIKGLLGEIPELYEHWSNLGVETFEIQTLVLSGRANEKLLPDGHEFIDMLKKLYDIRTPRTVIKVNCMWFTCLYPEIMHTLSEILFEECLCGTYTLNIKADGEVTICPFADFSVGNIHKQTLKEIYNSDFLRQYRTIFNEDCYSCLLFRNCHGRCRLMSYLRDKDLSKKPYWILEEGCSSYRNL